MDFAGSEAWPVNGMESGIGDEGDFPASLPVLLLMSLPRQEHAAEKQTKT